MFFLRLFQIIVVSLLPFNVQSSPVIGESFSPGRSFAASRTASAASSTVSVALGGVTYVNKGIVGFGLILSNFTDSLGDTLGGIGSAIAFKQATWKSLSNGSYTGTLVVHPDRGFNVISTVDYRARQHDINFVFTPYTGTEDLDFESAQKTLQLAYVETTLQFDRGGGNTSGLDALAIRPAESGFPDADALADPEMPIANATYQHLTIDAEGMIAASDGSYWVSDEYGPYIYHFTANGSLIQTIQPPDAFLPLDSHGNVDFTSVVNPTTGRAGNTGFEGLTLDASSNVLYAMLQAATIQDGGDDDDTSLYTRMVAYDIADATITRPTLVGEWVVPLPVSTSKSKTRKCSEIHFVSENVFLALSRDGNGNGAGTSSSDTTSKYKQADLFSIVNATNIAGSKFDDPSNPVAPNGVLDESVAPATYVSFVNYIDDDQLARFGLHNGGDEDSTLVNEKWESLALAPVNDSANPDDYFLFTASDNDFLTEDGISIGVPYNAGVNVDNQFLVFQVTLPSVSPGSVQLAIGV
ncbi:esterase-like activity of phytase-domain-containing protein [Lentinula aciculospora]|uniref:Esterase-like activity of phytase-domain-containing protein n=1 Tax=Lentinula aciculospora TaxID=153920 RepID=A0A9W8ZT60_9AGAR|nr:esterase-like activity of phytase-domain-containing protein [Lentinula aciculospora]KAJ4467079.1 esterase-like activity of phytase-domain-containing protein [Lentinula aciculospora]